MERQNKIEKTQKNEIETGEGIIMVKREESKKREEQEEVNKIERRGGKRIKG